MYIFIFSNQLMEPEAWHVTHGDVDWNVSVTFNVFNPEERSPFVGQHCFVTCARM